MSDYMNDQAAGLRRLMAEPKPRIVSILSASYIANRASTQPRLITNLAASIRCHGSDVLIVHAAQDSDEATDTYELAAVPALMDVAMGKTTLKHAIKSSSHGCYVARLLRRNLIHTPLEINASGHLNTLFNQIAREYEIVLVDALLNRNDVLPLQALNESEIIIELDVKPESIKQAYVLIKKICSQLGRRPFGIVVSDASEEQAQVVFRNIAQVARRFMQIELEFFGAIPTDNHLTRASRIGRAVIDAFPMAISAAAFKELAQRLDYRYDYTADAPQVSYS